MNTLDFANFYIQQKWQVLPLRPRDKKPLIPWKNGGSTDENTVRGWFDLWPDANIGIVTGRRSGIIVLDVDPAHGGEDTIMKLFDEHGIFPETPISRTGGGGWHYLFSHPGIEISNTAGKLGAGLDIRGDGGQICAPPSLHASGKLYKWDEHFKPSKYLLAPMPKWLLELLKENKPAEFVRISGDQDFYEAGTRNSSLMSLAGTMHRRKMAKETIYIALQSENERRCSPPLPDDEVKSIVESVSRYPQTTWPGTGKQVSISIQAPVSSNNGLSILSDELEKPKTFVRTGISNLDEKLGGLPRGYLTLLAARPGMGKTTLAMQIARNVAVQGKKVLFFSLEMLGSELWLKAALGIAEVAWRDYSSGDVPAGTKEKLQKIIIPELMENLGNRLLIYDADQNTTTTDMVNSIVASYQPDLVIIDHLAYLADGAENEVKRLGLICRHLRTIAAEKEFALLLLHHVNRSTDDRKNATKEPRMADIRGSGEIEQAADIILMPYIPSNYEMQEEKPRISLAYIPVTKNRIGEVGIHIVLYFDGLGQWFYRKDEMPVNLIGKDYNHE